MEPITKQTKSMSLVETLLRKLSKISARLNYALFTGTLGRNPQGRIDKCGNLSSFEIMLFKIKIIQ